MKKIYLKGSVEKSADGFYQITASTSAIDRQGDSIDQAGWDLTNFKANPVLLWAHDYSEFPIGKVVDIAVIDGSLKAKFEFAPEDANPKAAQIQRLYEGGYVNASSVGLIPKTREGNIITSAELLELSLVPVPANQEALRLAVSNKSLDLSLIEKDFEKGAVGDELAAEETSEQKWEKWDEVCEVFSALWTVFFDEATPVTDFSKLLTEAIGLLQSVAGDDGANDDDTVMNAIRPDNTEMFVKAMIQKSGKTLSKKTIEKVDASISSMQGAIKVLEDLKKENDQTDAPAEVTDEGGQKKVEPENEQIVELSLADFLKTVQSHVRTSDKSNEQANLLINGFLSRKGK